MEATKGGHLPLFETKEAKSRMAYRLFALSMLVAICLVLVYRVRHVPSGEGAQGSWAWIGLFVAELWLSFAWVLHQPVRWKPVYRYTFKDRLSQRFEKELPGIDIFVCTADPRVEPPVMVINTVLSVMAYDYPPEKLSVYLSDDGGSELTFYAMIEASRFSKHWLPFCKKFKVEPSSPSAYFSGNSDQHLHPLMTDHYSSIKKLYVDMENRIKIVTELGQVPKEIRREHKGFLEWDTIFSPRDHQTILQILIDGKDPNAVDMEGQALPSLVYMAREKRPQYHHNFKAGAMNALIRVSSKISNGSVILNVDCDIYSNSLDSVRDALCFLMDEEKGHEIAFVQYPQSFNNITKNDIYGNSLRALFEADAHGFDGFGGILYMGTGCFHRRDTLCGMKYTKAYKKEWKSKNDRIEGESLNEFLERVKALANCNYEENTQWGKEMGLKYGCALEDVITGLDILYRGWKSIYLNPAKKAFLGVAPVTLDQMLVQHKRWAEGQLQIFLSRYCPFWQGHGRINIGLQMMYSHYNLWATYGPPTLYYLIIPSLCLLKGIPLFPKISSAWFLPFAYLIIANCTYSLGEFLWAGGSLQAWWNDKRIWIFRRTSSYVFTVLDTMLKVIGITESGFAITAKVADDDVMKRYEQEMMEFGNDSPMFTLLTIVALLNLLCLLGGMKRLLLGPGVDVLNTSCLQIFLCAYVVAINLPIYQGIYRTDKGRIPSSLALKSFVLALMVCMLPIDVKN